MASLIRTLIADAIQNRLADPRIPPITSVTRVEVSDDLAIAHVSISVMGRDPERRLCLAALRHAAGRLRRGLAPHLRLRQLPRLEFRLDDSVRRSFETVCRIDEAMRELGEGPAWERDEEGAPEAPPPAEAGPEVSPGAAEDLVAPRAEERRSARQEEV